MNQNEWNSKAIKQMLDVQMIEHLVQRQDVEDRKKLMMFGGENKRTKTRPPSTGAMAQSTQNFVGEKISHSDLQRSVFGTRNAGRSVLSPDKTFADEGKISSQPPVEASPERPDGRSHFADSVLKVDPNCLNCSGNMAPAIKGIKTACLMYQQSKIPYQNHEYHIDDILRVKASVVANC